MVVLALSLFAAPASAEEPAPAPVDCATLEGDAKTECEKKEAEAKLEALGDCATKEGDAKAACDKEKAELEAKLAAAPEAPADEGKGGKAQRSNTNRMEADVTEE